MDCKQADMLIMRYAESTIEPNDAQNLTKHLLMCKDCRESFVAFDICLDKTPIIEAPADFTQNVMARIIKETHVKLSASVQKSEKSRLIQAAAGLGAVLLGVLLFFVLNFGYSGDFFGTMFELVQYYSVVISAFFEGISWDLSVSANFSRLTFIFVPVLCVLLFVLHSGEKSDISPGDSVEA